MVLLRRARLPLLALLAGSLVQAQVLNGNPLNGTSHHDAPAAHHGSGLQAHVHGVAELLVVMDGEQLNIELYSPAMNVLGFEHYVDSPDQKISVSTAKAMLANATRLFQFTGAVCSLTEFRADFSGVLRSRTRNAVTDSEGRGDGPNLSQRRDGDHDQSAHRDISAYYQFRCKKAEKFDSFTTDIIRVFPGVKSLQVQWVVNGRQGTTTLDNSDRHLNFR
ncbi:DUF2796 domain-containing protein [Zhongshania sp.]|uniref:ZrgA family zinc uptake protein n=1 Tax=Zhongshania sp. TaxID=1971902 RepID=UPI003568A3BF